MEIILILTYSIGEKNRKRYIKNNIDFDVVLIFFRANSIMG